MIQSESFNQWRMFAYIIRQLAQTENVEYQVENGNIYVIKGNADLYPCIVAHMDTVHDITDDLSLVVVGTKITGFNKVTMKQTGVGGDDKVGIFVALEALERYDNIKLAFFRDEEVGCVGSGVAWMEFFNDCAFVLQCDRRGNTDFITNASGTQLTSKEFKKEVGKIISKFGYRFENGMMTDVMVLKENGLPISCANIACGYYNPHMSYEYVDTKDVANCLKLVYAIIDKMGGKKWEHKYTAPKWSKVGRGWYDEWDDYRYQPVMGGTSHQSDNTFVRDKDGRLVYNPKYTENPKHRIKGSVVDELFKDFEKDDEDDFVMTKCENCLRDREVRYYAPLNALLCDDCKSNFE